MVESLIRLEHQVGKLLHHHQQNGHVDNASDGSKHEGSKAPPDGSSEPEPSESLLDAAYRVSYDEVPHSAHTHRLREPPETSLDKLAHRVEGLRLQVQHLMKNSQDRFEKYGENIVPPSPKERGEQAPESKHGGWNDGREYYQGGR